MPSFLLGLLMYLSNSLRVSQLAHLLNQMSLIFFFMSFVREEWVTVVAG